MEQPNFYYIKELSSGDVDFEKKLIAVIQEEFPVEKQTYFSNVAVKNANLTAEIVHKLKHKISILGLEKGYETAVLFENNLRDEQWELQKDFEDILSTITLFLASL